MNNIQFKTYATLIRIHQMIYKRCFPQRWQQENFQRNNTIRPDYKCVFIHIPKTGGMSILKILNNLPPKGSLPIDRQLIAHKHSTATAMKQILGNEVWEDYFSFSFVRNPWDFMISHYNWLTQKAYKFKYYHPLVREIEKMNFNDFVKYGHERINQQLHGSHFSQEDSLFNRLTQGKMFDWISEEDQIIVDYVGRFETLQEDWDNICDHIGINHQKLPHLNKTQRKQHYREYYTEETKQIIYEKFKPLIERYGYEF